VGVHADVQVTSTNWGRNRVSNPEQLVTQVFGSACSVAYNSGRGQLWKPLASLVLEASYEATLWAAVLNADRHKGLAGSRRVFLTCLGGGAFGNSMDWIMQAMRQAVARFAGYGLDVRVVTYAGSIDPQLLALEQEFAATRPEVPKLVRHNTPSQATGIKRPPTELLSPEKTAKEARMTSESATASATVPAKPIAAMSKVPWPEPVDVQLFPADTTTTPAKASKARKACKRPAAAATTVEASVMDEAMRLGYRDKLQNLVAHPDIIAAGFSPKQALKALKASGGLLHPARRALVASRTGV